MTRKAISRTTVPPLDRRARVTACAILLAIAAALMAAVASA
jgi:hypothetical protein